MREPLIVTIQIYGQVEDGWEPVLRAFINNFENQNEVGASVCVMHEGETKVDLWAGVVDDDGTPWQEDTMVVFHSATKGGVALAAHLLADRGKLDFDAPVSEIWPEFATRGKEKVTNRMMLNHTSGVAAFREALPGKSALDWDYVCDRLAAEEPWWEPGSRNGYHMATFGWTAGELVRRSSGQSLGSFFRTEVAEPADADFWIGLPKNEHHRVSNLIRYKPVPGEKFSSYTEAFLADKESMQAKAWYHRGGAESNDPASWEAELGGGGGIGNARGLARVYNAPALGEFVGSVQAARMSRVSVATESDAMLLLPTAFSEGFMKRMDNTRNQAGDYDSVLIGDRAFGHVGMGGSIGFADPDIGLAMGYAMNRLGKSILLDSRGQSLVDAAYSCCQ